MRYVLVPVTFVCCALSLHAADVFLQVKPTAAGGVYTVGETPTVTLSSNVVEKVMWRLLDWKREKLRIGEWPKDGQLAFPDLPQGYYYVQTRVVKTDGSGAQPPRDCTFCIVADPKTRVFSKDSFYGTDAALSWVCAPNNYAVNWYGDNSYRAALDLIRLCGLANVRERMTWNEVAKKPGEYDWGKYLQNARFAQERGITLSGVFHDAPKYAKRGGKGPVDPSAVYRFCRDAAKAFGPAMGDWEFWNEPDISFWPDPAWDFASASKAAFLGFRAGNPGVLVLNGAMAYTAKGTMSATLFDNDLAKYSNVLNCHAYGAPAEWADFFGELRPFMKRVGLEGRQVWFTESSTNIEGESRGEGLTPGFKAHSYEQELVVAELYAKNSSSMQMEGLAHNYFFVFGAYNERNGTKDWGVQRRDGSVKLVYSAIATMTEHLSMAKLEGEKKVGDGVKCYVFRQPDGSQSVVCWSVSPVDEVKSRTAYVTDKQMKAFDGVCALAVKDGTYPCANWCGTKGTVEAKDGKLVLATSRYAMYVDGLSGLTVDVPARPTGKTVEYVPPADEDLSVVTAIEFAKSDFTTTKGEAGLEGDHGKVTLRIWNFSDTEKKGRVLTEGAALEGLPDEVTLPAGGGEVALEATLRITDWSNTVTRLVVTGVFDGKRTTRLFAPVRSDKMLLEGCEVVRLDANRPEFWKKNDSASETKITWDEKEQAVRFDLEWNDPKTDRWFYPQHFFKDRAESLDGATHLDCEVRMVSNKMENDVHCSHCMLYKAGEHVQYCDFLPPTDFWEKRRIVLTDAAGKCRGDGKDAFGLGFNPYGTKVTYWVRNLRVFKRKAVSPEELVEQPVSKNLRGHENIEWSTSYAFHLTDANRNLPRVFIVGDSIVGGYFARVMGELEGKASCTYWTSSYCVTSPCYLKFLSIYLDEAKYDVIHFNNGCHSFSTANDDWEKGLRAALQLIRLKQPQAKIVWATTTPNGDAKNNAKVRELNAVAAKVIAEVGGIETDDLYALMDPLDRKTYWSDNYHFKKEAIDLQVKQVKTACLKAMAERK